MRSRDLVTHPPGPRAPRSPAASNTQGAPAATPAPASRAPGRESIPGSCATISAGSPPCWLYGIPASSNTAGDTHCAHADGTNSHSDNIFDSLGCPSSPPGSKSGRIQSPSSPGTRLPPRCLTPPSPPGRRKKRIHSDLQTEENKATSNRRKKRHFKVAFTIPARFYATGLFAYARKRVYQRKAHMRCVISSEPRAFNPEDFIRHLN